MTNPKFQFERVSGTPVSATRYCQIFAGLQNKQAQRLFPRSSIRNWANISPSTPTRRFGTWNKAVIAAGLDVANEINISDERLFENIMLLWEHFGRQPRRAELARAPSFISQQPYNRRFRSWTDALTKFVEFANAQEIQPPTSKELMGGHKTPRDPSLRLRFRVMKRDNFTCRACGATPALKSGLLLHVDHIEPWTSRRGNSRGKPSDAMRTL